MNKILGVWTVQMNAVIFYSFNWTFHIAKHTFQMTNMGVLHMFSWNNQCFPQFLEKNDNAKYEKVLNNVAASVSLIFNLKSLRTIKFTNRDFIVPAF